MEKTTFTRQELYELVWSEPLIRLSRKYNIYDNGLRKICIRMNIYLPNIGHKKQFTSLIYVSLISLCTFL
jgi:hypothetical protein